MADFERVASVEELQPGGRLSVLVDDVPVLLLQTDAGYQAVEDVCTHDGQPLTDGPVHDGAITCLRHGAKFDLATGKPLCMPATQSIAVYEVKIDNGSILLRRAEAGQTVAAAQSVGMEVISAANKAHETCGGGTCSSTPPGECATADESKSLDQKMIDALRNVIDPELMVNIVDLGLVYSVNHDGQKAYVDMTLTSPACPAGPQIVQQAKMSLERLKDIDEAVIKLVMTPPWTPDRMTEEARDMLGIF